MLFSKEKWNNAREIAPFVPTSASLSFAKMEAPLAGAEDQFVKPLLGEKMADRLTQCYLNPPEGDVLASQLLQIARRAVVNLAFWHDFDALNLRITDQGFQ